MRSPGSPGLWSRGSRKSEQEHLEHLKTTLQFPSDHEKDEEATETQPLLGVEDTFSKSTKRKQKYSTLNLDSLGMPFQERLARAQILLDMDRQSWISKKITEFLEDPDSSACALYYYYGISSFTLFGMIFAFLPALNVELTTEFKDIIDVAIDSILLTETVIRFICYPSLGAIFAGEQRWENLIDCTSALPVILLAS